MLAYQHFMTYNEVPEVLNNYNIRFSMSQSIGLSKHKSLRVPLLFRVDGQ